MERDSWGRFLDAYGEYLRGERTMDSLPLYGGRWHLCPRCDRQWMDRNATFSIATWVRLCADCETWAREPQQPLPVAMVVRRRWRRKGRR